MSWGSYVESLMGGGEVEDAAIVGCEPNQESVWAAHKGGYFSNMTPAEIRTLVSKERSGLFATGCMMGGLKCTLLRDSLHTDGENTMDIRTKATEQHPETFNICAGKSHKALVIVRGKKDSHGGSLNKIVHKMITHLKASGY